MVIEVRPSAAYTDVKFGDRTRQQVFLSRDALLIYYANYFTYTNNKRRYGGYKRTFVRVPYTSQCSVSGKTITFTGNILKSNLNFAFMAKEMSPEDAEKNAVEAQLPIMSPSKPVNSEKLLEIRDPEMIREITRAFELKRLDLEEAKDISSWRTLLDQYLLEKKENLDTADTTIQAFWFADYLARRRQARLGVKASQLFVPKGDPDNYTITHHKRGRCKRTDVQMQGEMIYKYETASEKLEFSTKLPPVISIVSTDQTPESRICPNCGSNVDPKDALEGCKSCGTLFRVTDYDFKVSGESLFHTKVNIGGIYIGCLAATFILSFLVLLQVNSYIPIHFVLFLSLFATAIIGPCLVFIMSIVTSVPGIFRLNAKFRIPAFCTQLRRNDPNISAEEFEAEMLSRIRTFFLAETTDDIRVVSGAKPGQFQDIVDVRIKEVKKIALVPNKDFQIVRAHVILDLVRLKNNKLVREDGNYAFDIYRLATTKTELRTDKEIYTCPSCASSLSILDGGRCKFCGNTTDLSRYGWVLGAVQAE